METLDTIWDLLLKSPDYVLRNLIKTSFNSFGAETELSDTFVDYIIHILDSMLQPYLNLEFNYLNDNMGYMADVVQIIVKNTFNLVNDMYIYRNRGNKLQESSINNLNDFLATVQRQSVEPYNTDSNDKIVYDSEMKINKNSMIFEIPENKWVQMTNFKNTINNLSYLLKTIYN